MLLEATVLIWPEETHILHCLLVSLLLHQGFIVKGEKGVKRDVLLIDCKQTGWGRGGGTLMRDGWEIGMGRS